MKRFLLKNALVNIKNLSSNLNQDKFLILPSILIGRAGVINLALMINLFLLLSLQNGHAQTIEQFNYTAGTTALNGKTGGAGSWCTSGSNGWFNTNTGLDIVSGTLSYTKSSLSLNTLGSTYVTTGTGGQNNFRKINAYLGQGCGNATYFISFLVRQKSGSNTNGYAGISLFSSNLGTCDAGTQAGTEQLLIGKRNGSGNAVWGFQIGNNINNGNNTGVTYDTTTRLIVAKISAGNSGSWSIRMWVDPPQNATLTDGQIGGAAGYCEYLNATLTGSTCFEKFRIEAGGGSAIDIDEFRFSTSYTDVIPVMAIGTPTIAITSGTNPACSGSSITFTATPGSNSGTAPTYQWLKNGVNISGATSSTYTATAGTAFVNTDQISCRVTQDVGSSGLSTSNATSTPITITTTTPPNAGTLSGIQSVCVGRITTFSTNGTTGGSWSSSASAIASVNTLGAVSGVSAGSATITYSLNGTGGCSNATATRTVTVNPLPTAGITNNSGSTVITCLTTSISVTATGGTSYSWSDGSTIVGTSAGLNITAAGTYTVTVTDSNGCSSTANIVITQDTAATSSSQTVTACDTYLWSVNGTTYTTSGTYTFVGTNAAGCVDTKTLVLTINSSTTSSESVTACDTYTWSLNGQTYTTSGTRTFTSTNGAGCPDTKTLVLTINSSTSSSQTVSACDTYTWSAGNGNTYTSSGTYIFTGTNAAGCTDTKTLVLTIYASTPSSQTVTACDTYTWTLSGQTYTSSGTYVFEGTNAAGCSQNVTLNLTINNSTSSSQSVTACDTYTWSVNGQTYTTSGTYTFVGTNAAGCPDTKTLVLTINSSTSSSQTVSACETYTWTVNEQTYTTSGTYTSTSTNEAGCTDTKTLVLRINTPTSSSQTVSACDTYSWSVNGQSYTESGTYTFVGTNAAGCTDTKTLVLTINASTSSSESVTACDTYTWSLNGQTYTTSGTRTFTSTNEAGCPDTKTLVLTINNSTSSSQTVSACETYTWTVNEQTYTTSGTYTSTSTNEAGCTDTKTLVLTINTPTSSSQSVTACDTYTWSVNGTTYNTSGTYTFVGTNAAGCTDTKTLNLTINSSTSSSQTVTACSTYTWSVNGTTYTTSGTYTFVGTNAAGCTDTKTLVLTIEQVNRSNATTTWTNGQNDNTTGFGAWALTASGGTAGFFSGSSDVNNGGTRSWGMFASGGANLASAIRPVTMGVGNTLSYSMDNGFIDSGKVVGFGLQNASGQNLVELLFIGGQSFYKINDNVLGFDTSIGYTNGGLDVSLTYTALNTYSITITTKAGATVTYTGRNFANQVGGQSPAQIRFFNAGAGTGSSFDLFFNSLAINNPVISTQPLTTVQNVCAGTATTNLNVAASGSDLTYQWFSSTSNTTYAGATSLGTGGQTATLSPQNSTAGTLYYFCIVTGPCGSTYSNFSGAVTVTSPPNAGSLSGIQEICVNGLATFSTNGTSGGSWSSSASGIASVNTSGAVSGVSAGSAIITYTLNGTGGCSNATATRSVTVNPLPTAGITNNTGSTVITCSITSISFTATGGDSYSWSNGTSVVSTSADLTITAGGTYTVTVTNSFGCSSTASITITENKTTTSSETVSVCDTYTWSLNGQTYTTSGIRTFTSTNEAGCVNTATLNLTITPSTTTEYTQSACDTYTWSLNGQTYTTSGNYTRIDGCHTDILHLTITPSSENTTVITACDSYFWSVTGETYTESDGPSATIGCVTEILDLTINYSTSNTTTITQCDGSYTWEGPLGNDETYTESTTVTNVTTNAEGCDHTETLVLTINNSTSESASVTACDSYTWIAGTGVTYTASGTYTSTGLNAAGCTHTKTLVLTITPSTSGTTTASACDSYTWTAGNGNTYTESGSYTYVTGCHTQTLVLTITPSTSGTTTQTQCDGSYVWAGPLGDGQTYTASNSAATFVSGCNTQTLNLTINSSTTSTETVTSPTCGTYTWSVNNQTYTSSGTYTVTGTNAAGCQDTKTLVLTINPCESVVTVKMNIEGYYDTTAHAMRPVMANQSVGSSSTDVDTVTIELHDATTYALVATTTATLQANGNAVATFSTAPVGSFYIAVKHRNAVETWSADPVTIGASSTYDFTDAADKAFGSNMQMLESGVYGFYSGDLDSDSNLGLTDYSIWEESYNNFESGYFATDLDGDGNVGLTDYSIWEANYNNFVSAIRP